jgi:hypothetical protein
MTKTNAQYQAEHRARVKVESVRISMSYEQANALWEGSKGRIDALEEENARLQAKAERAEETLREVARALAWVQGRAASLELYARVIARVREVGRAWQRGEVVPQSQVVPREDEAETGWVEADRLDSSRQAKAYHREHGVGGL